MDAGEAAGDDGLGAAEPGLHGGVLAGRALAVVLVADGHPGLRRPRGSAWRCRGSGLVSPSSWSLPMPASPVKALTAPRKRLPRDVLEVAAVLEPRAGRRDVVGGALALGLHQHGQVEEVLAVPGGEGLEQLQPVAGRGRPSTVDAATRRPGERGSRSRRGRSPAPGSSSPTGTSSCTFSPASLVSVSVSGSKSTRAGEREGDDGLGRGDEGERATKAVVALREVAVVGGDDDVGVALLHVVARPLADARAAGVGQHGGADAPRGRRAGRRARWWPAPARSRA